MGEFSIGGGMGLLNNLAWGQKKKYQGGSGGITTGSFGWGGGVKFIVTDKRRL